MSVFPIIFRQTVERAAMCGKSPVICLLGPDAQKAFQQFCGEWAFCMKPMDANDPWKKEMKDGDLGTFEGVRLRAMNHDGLAILT